MGPETNLLLELRQLQSLDSWLPMYLQRWSLTGARGSGCWGSPSGQGVLRSSSLGRPHHPTPLPQLLPPLEAGLSDFTHLQSERIWGLSAREGLIQQSAPAPHVPGKSTLAWRGGMQAPGLLVTEYVTGSNALTCPSLLFLLLRKKYLSCLIHRITPMAQ